MTNIGPIIAELEHIWRVRCAKCGRTQILAYSYKWEAESYLRFPLLWTKSKTQGWLCPRDHVDGEELWNPVELNESL